MKKIMLFFVVLYVIIVIVMPRDITIKMLYYPVAYVILAFKGLIMFINDSSNIIKILYSKTPGDFLLLYKYELSHNQVYHHDFLDVQKICDLIDQGKLFIYNKIAGFFK